MTDLLALWMPIALSGVVCFFASFVLWAATPWHKPDMKVFPDQDAADRAFAGLGLAPGHYAMPQPRDREDCKSEAFQDRYKRGPWLSVMVQKGMPNMGKNMALSVGVFLVISLGVAYVAGLSLSPGADYLRVFRVCGSVALLAYGFGGMINGVWFGKPMGWVVRDFVDAVIYAMLTAGFFGWLWPAAAAATGGALPTP